MLVTMQQAISLTQWQLMEKFYADIRIKLASPPSCVGTVWRKMVITVQKYQNYIQAFITKELCLWNFRQSSSECRFRRLSCKQSQHHGFRLQKLRCLFWALIAVRRSCVWFIIWKAKGKAIPLQASTGHKGSRRLRLPDFKTIATWRW
jgi:hypothetical protein